MRRNNLVNILYIPKPIIRNEPARQPWLSATKRLDHNDKPNREDSEWPIRASMEVFVLEKYMLHVVFWFYAWKRPGHMAGSF